MAGRVITQRVRARARVCARCAMVGVLAAGMAAASTGPGSAASSSVTVTMQVQSATTLSTASCAPGSGGLDFGVVQPGTSAVTGADCRLVFGSTNDTSSVRVVQQDGAGAALYRPSRGTPDTANFNAPLGHSIQGCTAGDDSMTGVASIRGGGFFMAGYCDAVGANPSSRIIKMTAAGTTDGSFGFAGHVGVDLSTGDERVYDLVVDAAARPIVAGYANMAGNVDAVLYRRLADGGGGDAAFGVSGLASIDPQAGMPDLFRSVEQLPDGRLVAVGQSGTGTAARILVARFKADGTRDETFGAPNGWVLVDPSGTDDIAYGVAVDAAGAIYVAGATTKAGYTDGVLAKLSPTGALDGAFNGTGIVERHDGEATANTVWRDVALQASGRILAGGTSVFPFLGGCGYAQAFLPSGAVDPSFNGTGQALFDCGVTNLNALLVQPDQRIVAAGFYGASAPREGWLKRLGRDGRTDRAYIGGINAHGVDNAFEDVDIGVDGALRAVGGRVSGTNALEAYVEQFASGGSIPDYASTGPNWASASVFGACLRAASAGAVATWATTGTCAAVDGTNWNGIPATGVAAATIATAPSGDADALVDLRFGVKVPPSQAPDTYAAPITFEVVAPA